MPELVNLRDRGRPAPPAPAAPVLGGGQRGELVDTRNLTRAASLDVAPDLAPLLAPLQGMKAIGDAVGGVGALADQYVERISQARDVRHVTDADTSLRRAFSEFETWRSQEGAADETQWPAEWERRARATLSRFHQDNNLSPRAMREVDVRADRFVADASVRTARDGTQRTFARGRAGIQSAIEMGILDRNPAQVKEATAAGVETGLYFPDEADLIRRKANDTITAAQRQDRFEALEAQAWQDPDSVLDYVETANAAPAIGAQVTSYGYASDPHLDTNSANGIGHSDNQLHAGLSVALMQSTAEKMGLERGEDILVTLEDGTTRRARYDDTIPPDYDEDRIDFYTPDGPVAFDGQKASIKPVPGGIDPQGLQRLRRTALQAKRERKAAQFDTSLDAIASGQTSEDAIRANAGGDLSPYDVQKLLNYAAQINASQPTDPAIYADILRRVEAYDPAIDPGGPAYLSIKGAIATGIRRDDMGELVQRLYRKRLTTGKESDTPEPRKELFSIISKTLDSAFDGGAFHPGGEPPERDAPVDLGAEATAIAGYAAALMASHDYLFSNPEATTTEVKEATLGAVRAPALGLSAALFGGGIELDPLQKLNAIATGRDTDPEEEGDPLSFLTWQNAEADLRTQYPDGKVPLHIYRKHQRTWGALTGSDPKTTGPDLDRQLQEIPYEDIGSLLQSLTGSRHPDLLRRWQDRHNALNGN